MAWVGVCENNWWVGVGENGQDMTSINSFGGLPCGGMLCALCARVRGEICTFMYKHRHIPRRLEGEGLSVVPLRNLRNIVIRNT